VNFPIGTHRAKHTPVFGEFIEGMFAAWPETLIFAKLGIFFVARSISSHKTASIFSRYNNYLVHR
jgi:hypothetical protein